MDLHTSHPKLLQASVAKNPDTMAVDDGTTQLSWRELSQKVTGMRRFLSEAGIDHRDRVACLIGNSADVFVILLATLHSGVTLVPINWHLTAEEIAYILDDSGSRLLFTDEARYGLATEAACLTGGIPVVQAAGVSTEETCLLEEEVCGSIMMYTSGTTGRPKGVVNNLFPLGGPLEKVDRMKSYAAVVLGLEPDGIFLLAGPWYHSSQLFFSLLSLLLGSTLCIEPAFSATDLLQRIQDNRVTATHLVPTQFVRLLRIPPKDRASYDLSSLRVVWHGGGPCTVTCKREMLDWFGTILVEYYGATETGTLTLITSSQWLKKTGSVGRAVAPNEIFAITSDGERLPPNEIGRLAVKRAGGGKFHYYNDPDKTARSHIFPDTFALGDLGTVDEDGYVYITGRSSDLIVTGGVNVYPAEVEAALLHHPAVRDVVVVGLPDPEFGDRVCAVIEAHDAPKLEDLPTTLDRDVRQHLAGFKVPRTWFFVPQVPRDPSGKVRRDALSALIDEHTTTTGTRDAAG